jgi:hypothetical protein
MLRPARSSMSQQVTRVASLPFGPVRPLRTRCDGPYAVSRVSAAFPRASSSSQISLFPRTYLTRLAGTQVSSEAAVATASVLIQEDAHYRALPAQAAVREQAPAPATVRDPRQGKPGGRAPLQQPRPQPYPGASPKVVREARPRIAIRYFFSMIGGWRERNRPAISRRFEDS